MYHKSAHLGCYNRTVPLKRFMCPGFLSNYMVTLRIDGSFPAYMPEGAYLIFNSRGYK